MIINKKRKREIEGLSQIHLQKIVELWKEAPMGFGNNTIISMDNEDIWPTYFPISQAPTDTERHPFLFGLGWKSIGEISIEVLKKEINEACKPTP